MLSFFSILVLFVSSKLLCFPFYFPLLSRDLDTLYTLLVYPLSVYSAKMRIWNMERGYIADTGRMEM